MCLAVKTNDVVDFPFTGRESTNSLDFDSIDFNFFFFTDADCEAALRFLIITHILIRVQSLAGSWLNILGASHDILVSFCFQPTVPWVLIEIPIIID